MTALERGYWVYYYERYYTGAEALRRKYPGDDQAYVIAATDGDVHVDGIEVRPQYATMANHRPPDEANAELGWDPDFGEFGQPFLRLLRDVAVGEEITADYGPWYAY